MQKLPTGAGAAGELLYEGIQLGRDATNFLGSPMGDALLVWSVLWYPFFGGPVYRGTFSCVERCYLGHQLYTWPTPMQKLPTGAGAAGELLYEGIQLGRDATNFLGSPPGDALLAWSV